MASEKRKWLRSKDFLLIALCVSTFTAQLSAQNSYRVKQLDSVKVDFILPPKAKIAREGLLNCKDTLSFGTISKYRYQQVVFKGLKKDTYYESCESINKAKYFYRSGYENHVPSEFLCSPAESTFKTSDGSTMLYLSGKGNCLVVEIDYDVLLRKSKEQVISNFQSMAIGLLTKLSELEESNKWPESICQNIVEKVFELIPIPKEATLSRYGLEQRSKYTIFPLNPKILLLVDTTSKVSNPIVEGGELFHFEGRKFVSFYRESSSGSIKQAPTSSIDPNFLPGNGINFDPVAHIKDGPDSVNINYYLISTGADLEFSKKLRTSKFLTLYQPVPKSGNLSESLYNDINACCQNEYDCTSQLIPSNDLKSIFIPEHTCGGMPLYTQIATFGEKNVIFAYCIVYINNIPTPIKMGTTAFQLIDEGRITSDFSWKRKFKGRLVKIKTKQSILPLLPTDSLNY